ncbi:hypothetical protein HYH03_007418 [Edaphochlamys debaryana]|uniref:Cyclic nucleotide-binding domain-containing protein n=1 Tax=Edaphochlamys debaryana TaxID=47281 RepID=A0A835Y560_9CHLO|nr:hypothetical protein HYH03_007418 [Edaphochlamys debaryana]|eukprot:KAG2494361.1 hypothetical protein HYH03_007418 [Edaphochlamys debaryana]
MDFRLPAVSRYLAETAREATDGVPASNVTAILEDKLGTTHSPTKLPKAVEAYFLGPAARGYHPPDAEAMYRVPFNKPPRERRVQPGEEEEDDDDENGTHTAVAVPPGSPPLAHGPPPSVSLQRGQVAAAITTPNAGPSSLVPLDWSHLFGAPASGVTRIPPGPTPNAQPQYPPGAAGSPAAGARVLRAGGVGATSMAAASVAADSDAASVGGASVGATSMRLRRQPSMAGSMAGSVAMSVVSRRGNAAAALLPQTPEGKFCGGVMGVMERLAATQAVQAGRFRSLRQQATEQREAMVSRVQLPPGPQTGAFSSKAASAVLESVLERSGASRDDMLAIVSQIKHFKGMSPDLMERVARQFQLFSYPPGSYLYEQDCRCDETFVLMSGACMLHVEGRPPQRLEPGTVLAVDLMMRRQAVPLTVTTDPHFEAQLAVLSWQTYEDTVRRWAAEKVAALLPDLQASQLARLMGGLVRGVSYTQREPGEPLYVGDQPVEHVALLVQGQVLLAQPWEENALVTEGQIVSQLKVLMGPLANAMVLNELPRAVPTRTGRGGLKTAGSVRGGDGATRSLGVSLSIVSGRDVDSVKPSRDVSGEGYVPSPTGAAGSRGVLFTTPRTEAAAAAAAAKAEGVRPRGVRMVDPADAKDEEEDVDVKPKRAVKVAAPEPAPESTPGEEEEAAAEAQPAEGSGLGSAAGSRPGSGGSGGSQQQRRRVRSGQSSGRNSRNSHASAEDGGDAAAAAVEPEPATDEAEGSAEVPDGQVDEEADAEAEAAGGTGSDAGTPALTEEAEAEEGAGADGPAGEAEPEADAAEEEAGAPGAELAEGGEAPAPASEASESRAATASRATRVSLKFMDDDASAGGRKNTERDQGPTPGSGEAEAEVTAEGRAGSPSAADAEATEGAQPASRSRPGSASAGGVGPEPSLFISPRMRAPSRPGSAGFGPEPSLFPGPGSAGLGFEGSVASVASLASPRGTFEPVFTGAGLGPEMSVGPLEFALRGGAAGGSAGGAGGGPDAGFAFGTPGPGPVAEGVEEEVWYDAAALAPGPRPVAEGLEDEAAPDPAALAAQQIPSTRSAQASEAGAVASTSESGLGASPSEAGAAPPQMPVSALAGLHHTAGVSPPRSLRSKIAGPPAGTDPGSVRLAANSPGGSRPTSPYGSGASTPTAASRAAAAAAAGLASAGPSRTGSGRDGAGQLPPKGPGSRRASASLDPSAGVAPSGRPTTPGSDAPSQFDDPLSPKHMPHPMLAPLPPPTGSGEAVRRTASGNGERSTAVPEDSVASTEAGGGGGAGGPKATDSGDSIPSKNASAINLSAGPSAAAAEDSGVAAAAAAERRPKFADVADGGAVDRFVPARVAVVPPPRTSDGGALQTQRSMLTAAAPQQQPLANAMAAQFKFHRQRVVAVFSGPVAFCEEALAEVQAAAGKRGPNRPTAAHSAIAMERCEFILIPAQLLRSLLPPDGPKKLVAAAVAAQRRLMAASGHVADDGPVVWPAAADRIREVLAAAPPGQRQPWQVELLAQAFSHMPAFARLTWQVRLRVFQDLEYRKLEAGLEVDLAKLEVTEVSPKEAPVNPLLQRLQALQAQQAQQAALQAENPEEALQRAMQQAAAWKQEQKEQQEKEQQEAEAAAQDAAADGANAEAAAGEQPVPDDAVMAGEAQPAGLTPGLDMPPPSPELRAVTPASDAPPSDTATPAPDAAAPRPPSAAAEAAEPAAPGTSRSASPSTAASAPAVPDAESPAAEQPPPATGSRSGTPAAEAAAGGAAPEAPEAAGASTPAGGAGLPPGTPLGAQPHTPASSMPSVSHSLMPSQAGTRQTTPMLAPSWTKLPTPPGTAPAPAEPGSAPDAAAGAPEASGAVAGPQVAAQEAARSAAASPAPPGQAPASAPASRTESPSLAAAYAAASEPAPAAGSTTASRAASPATAAELTMAPPSPATKPATPASVSLGGGIAPGELAVLPAAADPNAPLPSTASVPQLTSASGEEEAHPGSPSSPGSKKPGWALRFGRGANNRNSASPDSMHGSRAPSRTAQEYMAAEAEAAAEAARAAAAEAEAAEKALQLAASRPSSALTDMLFSSLPGTAGPSSRQASYTGEAAGQAGPGPAAGSRPGSVTGDLLAAAAASVTGGTGSRPGSRLAAEAGGGGSPKAGSKPGSRGGSRPGSRLATQSGDGGHHAAADRSPSPTAGRPHAGSRPPSRLGDGAAAPGPAPVAQASVASSAPTVGSGSAAGSRAASRASTSAPAPTSTPAPTAPAPAASAEGAGRAGDHTVESLFDPAAEEPLIPSLALLRRGEAEAASLHELSSPSASAPAPPPMLPTLPAAPAAAAGPVPPLALPKASVPAPTGGQVQGDGLAPAPSVVRGDSMTSLNSEAPSMAAPSAPVSPLYANYIVGPPRPIPALPPLSSEAAATDGPLSPVDGPVPAPEAAPPQAPGEEALSQQPSSVFSAKSKFPRISATTPLPREATSTRLDDRIYFCLSGSIALDATPVGLAAETSHASYASHGSSTGRFHGHSYSHGHGNGQVHGHRLSQEPSSSSMPPSARPTHEGDGDAAPASAPGRLQLAQLGDAFSAAAVSDLAVDAFDLPKEHTPLVSASGGLPKAGGGPEPHVRVTTPPVLHVGGPGEVPHTPPGLGPPPNAGAQQQAQAQAHPHPYPHHPQDVVMDETTRRKLALQALLPLGESVIKAKVLGGGLDGGAEVLCLSKPMFELLAGGVGRSVPPLVLPVLARHVDWLAAVDLQALATDLEGKYKLEEHKQGTELLRAGEPAPAVFLVAAGECVMRGPVVGLRDPSSVAEGLDLAALREGATCGELSLLAARPLWYSLVVASPTAKVISLDLGALRTWLLTTPAGTAAAAEVVSAVAEVDIALYARAVKQIAVQVLKEKLDLSLFMGPMKAIIRRVIEDNASELSAILQAQAHKEAQMAAEREAAGGKAGGGGEKTGANRPRTIVLEGWDQVEAIAATVAREYEPQAQSWELIAQARYNAARRAQMRYLDSLYTRSQLETQEDEGGHATGGQRIAMPAPGPVAAGLAEPVGVRMPKQHDVRTVPKDLRGSQVESARLGGDTAHLPTHELTAMMGAQVHVRPRAAEALAQGAPRAAQHAQHAAASAAQHATQAQASTRHAPITADPSVAASLASAAPPSAQSSASSVGASNSLVAKKYGGSPVHVKPNHPSQLGPGLKGNARRLGPGARPPNKAAGASASAATAAAGAAAAAAPSEPTTAIPTATGYISAAPAAPGVSAAAVTAALAADPFPRPPDGDEVLSPDTSPPRTLPGAVPGTADSTLSATHPRSRLRVMTPPTAAALHGLSGPAPILLSPGPEAPWDARGRLVGFTRWESPPQHPLAQSSGVGGLSKLERDLYGRTDLDSAAPSTWSVAPLEGHRGRVPVALSVAPSNASLALDPEFRAALDREIALDELREQYGTATISGLGAVSIGGLAGRLLAASLEASPENSRPNTTATRGGGSPGFGARGGGGGRRLAAIGEDGEPASSSVALTGGNAAAGRRGHGPLGRSLDAGVMALAAAMVAAGDRDLPPPPGKGLPPLPAPHDALALSRSAAAAAAAAGRPPSTAPAPVPGAPLTSAQLAAAGPAVPLLSLPDAPAGGYAGSVRGSEGSGGSAARRSRIQARSAPEQDGLEAPDRAFWVRDRLHDPSGLAQSVITDAAVRAVATTLADPSADTGIASAAAAAASGRYAPAGTSPNVLMTAGGRPGIPATGPGTSRSPRLQPLTQRRGAGSGLGVNHSRGSSASGSNSLAGTGPLAESGREGVEATPRAGSAGGAGAGGAGEAAPGSVAEMVAMSPVTEQLAEAGMLYVTLQVPPAPKLLPEFPSPAAARETAEAMAAAERAAREARLASALSNPATRPLALRPDMRYVPQYLRARQRAPVVPQPKNPLPEAEAASWAVPSYNSEIGFQDGFYDEDSQTIYFD